MRFGVCCGLDSAARVLEAGFDYVELGAGSIFGGAEYDPTSLRGLPVEATNLFFSGDIKLFGPERTSWREYVERMLTRAAEAGVQVMVVGSGGARRSPEGTDPSQAEAEFVSIAAEIQEMARPFGIVIAPESLNRSETNVGNDLAAFATALVAAGSGYTADSYHVLYEWRADGGSEPATDPEFFAQQMPTKPDHVHLASAERVLPRGDDPELQAFAAQLRELGYDGRVSLEARHDGSPEALRDALDGMKALFQ